MSEEYKLRAMGTNYKVGHCWDDLDKSTVLNAANEIEDLKIEVDRLRELLDKSDRHFDSAWDGGSALATELLLKKNRIIELEGLLREILLTPVKGHVRRKIDATLAGGKGNE